MWIVCYCEKERMGTCVVLHHHCVWLTFWSSSANVCGYLCVAVWIGVQHKKDYVAIGKEEKWMSHKAFLSKAVKLAFVTELLFASGILDPHPSYKCWNKPLYCSYLSVTLKPQLLSLSFSTSTSHCLPHVSWPCVLLFLALSPPAFFPLSRLTQSSAIPLSHLFLTDRPVFQMVARLPGSLSVHIKLCLINA